MRKLLIMVCVLCLTGFAMGQITGSAHDFSGETWSGGEICIVCHTPHNADTTVDGAPLWNHTETTTETFTLYSVLVSSTFNAITGQPDGDSKLCLSCHDGSVAVDAFGGAAGGDMIGSFDNGGTQTAGYANIGTDLSNDHPISFTYDAALVTADGGIHPITTTTSIGGTIESVFLKGGKVECSSCHDVHNAGFANLLIMSNAGSALCLECHDK